MGGVGVGLGVLVGEGVNVTVGDGTGVVVGDGVGVGLPEPTRDRSCARLLISGEPMPLAIS